MNTLQLSPTEPSPTELFPTELSPTELSPTESSQMERSATARSAMRAFDGQKASSSKVIDLRTPVVDAHPSWWAAAEAPVARLLRLLAIFPGLRDTATLPTRLFLIMVGFLPVTLIAASTFDVVGLRDLATHLLVPAVVATVVVSTRHRWSRRLVLKAMVVGALATGMYDLIRFGFIWTALMHTDPIPHIGVDLHLSPAWMVGYFWRYFGNGAGLAIAFFSLGLTRVRQGLAFGFFVAMGLISVLIVSPHASEVLWDLNTTSVSMIISGHLAFGAGLAILRRFINPAQAVVGDQAAAGGEANADGTGAHAGETVVALAA